MNSPQSPSPNMASIVTCECGAENESGAAKCWLCGRDVVFAAEIVTTLPRAVSGAESFSLATLFLYMTLSAVALGLFSAEPGLGILAAIVALPAIIRTTVVVKRRQALGKEVSSASKTALFATSFAVTAVVAIVITITAVGTFCGVCLGAATLLNMNGRAGENIIPFAGLVALVATILVALTFLKVIRRRYRHDIERP